MPTPVDALIRFLSSRSEADRQWLLVKLSFELDENIQARGASGEMVEWLTHLDCR
jgi:hypothetical protein